MQWIHDYDLFIFDLDGLLVNTEELHFRAYKKMCESRKCKFPWDFTEYCQVAHVGEAERLQQELLSAVPELNDFEWKHLYREKTEILLDLMSHGAIHMMPGAFLLLETLEIAGKRRCVVTHSKEVLVNSIKKHNPILNSIPVWLTKDHYTHPKPHPEGYLKAIDQLGKPNDRIIGFEDTPRGLQALLKTPAKPFFISPIPYRGIDFSALATKGVQHFHSLDKIC